MDFYALRRIPGRTGSACRTVDHIADQTRGLYVQRAIQHREREGCAHPNRVTFVGRAQSLEHLTQRFLPGHRLRELLRHPLPTGLPALFTIAHLYNPSLRFILRRIRDYPRLGQARTRSTPTSDRGGISQAHPRTANHSAPALGYTKFRALRASAPGLHRQSLIYFLSLNPQTPAAPPGH